MKNKKWYSLPRFYSWQYIGLLISILYLGWLSILNIGSSILFNGSNFLDHLDWQLVGVTILVLIWGSYIGSIEKDWDEVVTFSISDEIENYSDHRMYTASITKYIFAKLSLFISWIVILIVGYNWISNIQNIAEQHPQRIIISLLVVIIFLLYKKK